MKKLISIISALSLAAALTVGSSAALLGYANDAEKSIPPMRFACFNTASE